MVSKWTTGCGMAATSRVDGPEKSVVLATRSRSTVARRGEVVVAEHRSVGCKRIEQDGRGP